MDAKKRSNPALRFLPQRIRNMVERAARERTAMAANAARFHLRKHQREVRVIRAKVDSRIDRLRAIYYEQGLPVQRGSWPPEDLREELDMVHKLEAGIEAAWNELRHAYPEVRS